MNKLSSLLAPILFFGLAVLADILGLIINALQTAAVGAIITPVGAFSAAVAFFEEYVFEFGFTESAITAASLLFSTQAMISLIVIVIFFSLVLSSPKGRYPIFICILALTVFILESIPFVSALPIWSSFAWILRGRGLIKSIQSPIRKK